MGLAACILAFIGSVQELIHQSRGQGRSELMRLGCVLVDLLLLDIGCILHIKALRITSRCRLGFR